MKNTPTPAVIPAPQESEIALTVNMADILDISTINALREEIESALSKKAPRITLNGERVTRIDGAVLQLLTSFFREANSLGCEVQWNSPSPGLLRSAQMLGLARGLGLNDAGLQ